MIGSAMAGKLVEVPAGSGQFVSIFSDRYIPFNQGSGQQSKIDNIPDEDPDYYTDVSDNIHGDETVYKTILQITGSGFFSLKERAGYFVERLIDTYKKNQTTGLTREAANFQKTVKRKLSSWLIPTFSDGRSQSTPAETFGIKSKYAGKSVVVEMAKAGIVDFNDFRRAYLSLHGSPEQKAQASMSGVNAGFVSNFFARLFAEGDEVNIPNFGVVRKADYSKVFEGGAKAK
jgi:hypothetical protein